MHRQSYMYRAAIGALVLVASDAAEAQQNLPAIEVGSPRRNAVASKPRKPLQPSSPPRALAAAPAPLPEGEKPGSSQTGAGLGGRMTGYTVDMETPSVSTKDGIPLLNTPSAVKVIPRQLLDDQQAISVQDAIVGNVSGVQASTDTFYDGFIIRGFDNTNIFRNNLLTVSTTHLQTANLQSIEVLKGPAAMEFGRLEPGGLVNMIVKRPLDKPYFSFNEQLGSWGLTYTTIDATGPLKEDKSILYRVNAAFNHGNSFREFVTNQDAFIAPTITWRPTENFRINVDFEYQNSIFVADGDGAIPAVGNRPASIPVSRYLQDPSVTSVNPSRNERVFAGYDWSYSFDKDWSLGNRFGYTDTHYAQRITNIRGFDPITGDAQLGLWDQNIRRWNIQTNLDLKGKIYTGPLTHTLLVGGDYLYNGQVGDGYADYADPNGNPYGTIINIYNPLHAPFGSYVKPSRNNFGPILQSWGGIYGQDMISLLDDRVNLLLGGRHDWAWQAYGSSSNSYAEAFGPYDPTTGNGYQQATDGAWSPKLGVVLKPLQNISLYANYTRSFGLSNAIPAPGNPPLPPERALQWEGGVKGELFDKRLTATLAYYDIFKSGIVQSVAGTGFSRPVGLVHSTGVELDVAGRYNENWSLTLAYAYQNAHIVHDGNGPPSIDTYNLNGFGYNVNLGGQQGNRLQNVPHHSGSVWIKYDALGAFKGLSLGGGVAAVGAREGDNDNTYRLPGYARVDGMIAYVLPSDILPWTKKTTLQFNVKNLGNARYFEHSYDRYSAHPGAPRTFLGSIRVEF